MEDVDPSTRNKDQTINSGHHLTFISLLAWSFDMRLTLAAGVLSLISYVCHVSADAPGAPGIAAVPDKYNTLPGVDWNRTYAPAEPQQIHLSFGSESNYARVQFATLEQVDNATLRYWPKSKKQRVSRYGKVQRSRLDMCLGGAFSGKG